MIPLFKLSFLLTCLFLASCSTKPKSVLIGSTIGLGAGNLASGHQDDNNQKNTTLAFSAILGGAVGYLVASQTEKKSYYGSGSKQDSADFGPRLNRPEVRRVWIPDQIIGDEYISGHWKFLISQPAVWSKSDTTKKEEK